MIDDRTLSVVAHVGGIRFPDGLAYAPEADQVFVSDESGMAAVVIDARTLLKRSAIVLGGEAGNTQITIANPAAPRDAAAHSDLLGALAIHQDREH